MVNIKDIIEITQGKDGIQFFNALEVLNIKFVENFYLESSWANPRAKTLLRELKTDVDKMRRKYIHRYIERLEKVKIYYYLLKEGHFEQKVGGDMYFYFHFVDRKYGYTKWNRIYFHNLETAKEFFINTGFM